MRTVRSRLVSQGNQEALVKAALAGKVTRQGLQSAMSLAGAMKREALVPIIKAALDKLPAEAAAPAFAVNPATLPKYAGTYRDAASGLTMTVTLENGTLMSQVQGQPAVRLVPSAENVFRVVEVNATLTFNERGGLVESIGLVQGPANLTLARVTPEAAAASAAPTAPHRTTGRSGSVPRPTAPRNWPAFRGDGAAGNGDGQRAVTEWDVASGKNIKWKTPIPGVANSSPVVWGDRVFAVTAISKAGDNTFKTGLYGDVKPVDDLSEHQWKIYSLDKTLRKDPVGAHGCHGSTEDQAAHEGKSGEFDAGDRRTTSRRGVWIGRGAGRVGLQRQGAVACRCRCARQRMVLRSGVPVGPLELADHLSQLGDPAGRCTEGLVHRRVGSRDGQAALEDAAHRRDLHVGHADDRSHGRWPRRDRHQRHEDSRLRPGDREAVVDARTELGDHDRHARRRQRSRCSSQAAIRRCGRFTRFDPEPRETSRCRRDRIESSRLRGAT